MIVSDVLLTRIYLGGVGLILLVALWHLYQAWRFGGKTWVAQASLVIFTVGFGLILVVSWQLILDQGGRF